MTISARANIALAKVKHPCRWAVLAKRNCCLSCLCRNKNIVVGSHGTALSTIINYYDKSFGYSDFEKIRYLMPWIVEFTFEDDECIDIKKYNLFEY